MPRANSPRAAGDAGIQLPGPGQDVSGHRAGDEDMATTSLARDSWLTATFSPSRQATPFLLRCCVKRPPFRPLQDFEGTLPARDVYKLYVWCALAGDVRRR